MKNTVLILWMILGLATARAVAPLGTAFSYQGRLDDGVVAASGLYDFNFKLYDSAAGGVIVGPPAGLNAPGVTVTDGMFVVPLDFGAGAFPGAGRWLLIAVRTNDPSDTLPYDVLSPRVELKPTPYALYAANAGSADAVAPNAVNNAGLANNAVNGAKIANGQVVRSLNGLTEAVTLAAGANITLGTVGNTVTISSTGGGGAPWLLSGNGGTVPGVNFLGTTDDTALELKANSARALRIEPTALSPNLIGGHSANSVSPGWYGGSIGGGGAAGQGHLINGAYGTVAGGIANSVGANFASVGGGNGNSAAGQDSVVAGGSGNAATAGQSTVGGGIGNRASGSQSAVSGGALNRALGASSAIVGGVGNITDGTASFVGGGENNILTNGSQWSAVVSGTGHRVTNAWRATILNGESNTVANLADHATVLGGRGVMADKFGQIAFGSRFATNGDAQASLFHLRGTTTGAGNGDLFLNGTSGRLTVPRHSGWSFRALVIGKAINTPAAAAFEIRGLVVNVDGSTSVLTTTTALGSYSGIVGFNAIAVADDGNDALIIRVTSPLAATVRWSAQVETAEVNAPSTLF